MIEIGLTLYSIGNLSIPQMCVPYKKKVFQQIKNYCHKSLLQQKKSDQNIHLLSFFCYFLINVHHRFFFFSKLDLLGFSSDGTLFLTSFFVSETVIE